MQGAGKSTTINLCTGSLVPSSGDAIVYGRSVNHDTAAVRALMGLCPQHDVLFEQLTALEHLRLFGRFKGVPKEALERDIPVVLEAVKLTDVQNKAAGKYSGERKRCRPRCMPPPSLPSLRSAYNHYHLCRHYRHCARRGDEASPLRRHRLHRRALADRAG